MTSVLQIIIPFRDRGIDPRRAANLDIVQAWWYSHGFDPHIVSDGLEGGAQFNRHRAYNRAVIEHRGDMYVFAEADMLIHPSQIMSAITLAEHKPGIVVPFTQYRYLADDMTGWIRDQYHDMYPEVVAAWWARNTLDPGSIFGIHPESTMDNGRSIGAINVVSAHTLDITGGFTESTSGNWYDDNIIEEGFAFLTGNPTRHVSGPAVHMYHLPGHRGSHLTEADRAATARNKEIRSQLRRAIRRNNPAAKNAVKALMQTRF